MTMIGMMLNFYPVYMYVHVRAGFHLGFSSRGGGANATIVELKGGKDYSNTSCFFIHKEYYNVE